MQNYLERYQNLTREPALKNNNGMLNIMIDDQEIDWVKINQKYGNKSMKKIEQFINDMDNKAREINSNNFFISFDYTFMLTKKSSNADVDLGWGNDGESVKLVETPVRIEKKYPYKTRTVIEYINNLVERKINTHDLYAINYEYNIKKNKDFFILNENVPRYSKEFADWFTMKHLQDNNWLIEAREHFANSKRLKSKTSFKRQHNSNNKPFIGSQTQ